MHILIASHKFAPDIGGIETMSALLASQFTQAGHTVTLVTHSAGPSDREPYRVLRRPTAFQLIQAHRDADVVFHNNPCFQFAWPLLLVRRPWVVAVRTWLRRGNGRTSLRDQVKLWFISRASLISISNSVAEHLMAPSTIIPNSYRDDLFRDKNLSPRDPRAIVFVGRLIEDKGAHLLIRAAAQLRSEGFEPQVTVVGKGSQRVALEEIANELGVAEYTHFTGPLLGEELVDQLNMNGIIVVPSVWPEPFGIVALEGMASGCVPIVSDGGGLGEAVGSSGLTFPNGNLGALTDQLRRLMSGDPFFYSVREGFGEHLANHTAESMGCRYLDVIEAAAAKALINDYE